MSLRAWSWPRRLGEHGAGPLAAAVVGLVGVAVVLAWLRGPAATAPVVFPVVPGGAPSAALPADRWPGDGRVAPAGSAAPRFEAIAGVGCRATPEAGYYVAYPAGRVPDTRRGGWVGGGCTGLFWAVPMSGTTVDDPRFAVMWWFAPRGMARASCEVMVYVPRTDRAQDVAGRPTAYLVLRGRDDPTVVGTFSIDQTVNRGRWVSAGRYALDRGQIAVRLTNVGLSHADHHAAAQASVSCSRQE